MKITVVGVGYVGLSMAILLSNNNEVVAFDIDKKKIEKLKNKISPIEDEDIKYYLRNKDLNLIATTNPKIAYQNSDFIILSLPTSFDDKNNSYDTSIIENEIRCILNTNKKVSIVIKSTLPIGFTKTLQEKFNTKKIFFSPEFLREGSALKDNLYPSRIVIGSNSKDAKQFAKLLINAAKLEPSEIKLLFLNSSEAEAIKLFSNSYLAMRVAFLNELDSFAEKNNLNTKNIIHGLSLDPRIGDHYNNPSFGYGGYCLPKDTKQLVKAFNNIPNKIISAIVDSNKVRKQFIAKMISKKSIGTIGIYRLIMKSESDNIRSSAVLDIISELHVMGHEIIIFEPLIDEYTFMGCKVEKNINDFKQKSSLIVSNRVDDKLDDVREKTYTRDIFGDN